jgi:hypothetical protein
MYILSLLGWLSCCASISNIRPALAFAPQLPITLTTGTFAQKERSRPLFVASASSTSDSTSTTDTIKTKIANMERGVGGRIEDAFEAAKERGEAAFVTFVTAGYPSAKGESMFKHIHPSHTLYK